MKKLTIITIKQKDEYFQKQIEVLCKYLEESIVFFIKNEISLQISYLDSLTSLPQRPDGIVIVLMTSKEEFYDVMKTDILFDSPFYYFAFILDEYQEVLKYKTQLSQKTEHIYSFSSIRKFSLEKQEFDNNLEKTEQNNFWLNIKLIASNIFNWTDKGESNIETLLNNNGIIYIAPVDKEMLYVQEEIALELKNRGYVVLIKNYPHNVSMEEVKKEVIHNLEQSDVLIYLLDANYISYPHLSMSITEAAYRISKKYIEENSSYKKQSKIVWINTKGKEVAERQNFFIDEVEISGESIPNIEILRVSIEDFKSFIFYYIKERIVKKQSLLEKKIIKKHQIYLLADNYNNETLNAMQKWLKEKKFNVFDYSSDISSDQKHSVRNRHQYFLKECDAIIVFYSQNSLKWLISILQELIKLSKTPLREKVQFKAIFVTNYEQLAQLNKLKNENIYLKNVEIIYDQGMFSSKSYFNFLKKIAPELLEE